MAKTKIKKVAKLKLDFNFNSVFFKAGIVLLFLFAGYQMMLPVMDTFPQRDSGCFLYIGQNWLKGMIPYRDMWDHKGPLLYLLNAIGIFFDGMKGVMLLQVLMTTLGFYYLFITLSKFINHLAAVMIAISGFFILFFLHQSGNQTEQWALFFQGMSLCLFFKVYENKDVKKTAWLGIGLLMACSFLLRPNQIALWLIIGLAEIYFLIAKKQSVKALLFKLVYGLGGFLIPVVLFSVYFLYHHAFDEMLDCLFTYNFIYTNKSDATLLDNIKEGIKSVPFIWVFLACMALNLGINIIKKADGRQWLLFLFAAAWLVSEIVLSSIGGAGHLHYYVQWILPLLLVLGSFILSLKSIFVGENTNKGINNRQYAIYGQIALSLIFMGLAYFPFKDKLSADLAKSDTYKSKSMYREQIVDVVLSKTDDSDYVLVWGMVDGINFMAERRSPTRYFYPYALDTKGYTSEARVKEFMDDIKKHRPKYIIDFSRMERFPSVFPSYREKFFEKKPHMKGLIPSNIDSFYNYIKDHYETDDGKGDITGSALILMRLD